ncbi:MAG: hypothetical protein WBM13_07595 [Bacteroidia bacterium]
MEVDFENIFNQLKTGVAEIAKNAFKKRVSEITLEGHKILTSIEENIKNWTALMVDGDISKSDFEDLVLGQKDLIEIAGLKQLGLSKIQADQFKKDLLNLIINTVTAAV